MLVILLASFKPIIKYFGATAISSKQMRCVRMNGIFGRIPGKKFQHSDNSDPSFDCTTATTYFTNTYSDDTANYGDHLPLWVSESIPKCDASVFNTDSITPSLMNSTLQHCS